MMYTTCRLLATTHREPWCHKVYCGSWSFANLKGRYTFHNHSLKKLMAIIKTTAAYSIKTLPNMCGFVIHHFKVCHEILLLLFWTVTTWKPQSQWPLLPSSWPWCPPPFFSKAWNHIFLWSVKIFQLKSVLC